jgi:hypothetical protein
MAPKLNNGEGVAFFVQEATLKLKEAPGPAYEETAWLRRSGGKQRRCGGDGLPEEGSGGGVDKMHGECPFYSCVSRRSNTSLHKERRREVMARLGAAAERACAHAVAERSEGSNGRREGHARGGNFVRTPAS